MKFYVTVLLLSCAASAWASSCANPQVSVAAYTPADAQVLTHIPFVADFTLTCGGSAKDIPLYAKVEGHFVQIGKSKDSARYQLGFTRELKHAKTGDYQIPIFDEEGYAAVKRTIDRGEDASTVQPLTTITINYQGSYKGPYVSSELIAASLALLVFYFAFTTKSRLLA